MMYHLVGKNVMKLFNLLDNTVYEICEFFKKKTLYKQTGLL